MADEERREREWFDISVRRPREVVNARQLPQLVPTKTWASAHRGGNSSGEGAVKLVLQGFDEDAQLTNISSGLTLWETSDILCEYLEIDEDLRSTSELRLLELGSGLGKCGLVAHHLASDVASTVLTDGDTNTLQMLRRNVASNTAPDDDTISCQQLFWHERRARDFWGEQARSTAVGINGKFHLILGSDLIYTRSDSPINEINFVETVGILLHNDGKVILAHDEGHGVPVEDIVSAACRVHLFYEVLKTKGSIHLLCFRRMSIGTINSLLTRLHDENSTLQTEISVLRARNEHSENRCQCLEERCVALRGDTEDAPRMLSLGFDHMVSIASFLEAHDLVNLSSTCRQFGRKLHNIGTRDVSLWQKIAHGLYESASDGEKEALSAWNNGVPSPHVLYNELLDLRKPLIFAQLLGRGISHANGDKSQIVECSITGRVKIPVGGRIFDACTAVSNNVMRAGKHCVRFECPGGSGGNYPLWFGIVRPLQGIETQYASMFTPFCSRFVRGLSERRTGEWGDVQCCVYSATSGKCLWSGWNEDYMRVLGDSFASDDESTGGGLHSAEWQGMQSFDGGSISLLLDYDQGALTVFKDGVKLGVMKKNLVGPYSWMVSVHTRSGLPVERSSNEGIKIERNWVHQLSSLPSKREQSEI